MQPRISLISARHQSWWRNLWQAGLLDPVDGAEGSLRPPNKTRDAVLFNDVLDSRVYSSSLVMHILSFEDFGHTNSSFGNV